MSFCYTADVSGYAGRSIQAATNGRFNHALIRIEDDDGEVFYFESSWKRNPNGSDGVRGPIPYANLLEWASKPGHVLHEQDWLPLTKPEIEAALRTLNWAARNIGYAKIQLMGNLLQQHKIIIRLGASASDDRWTCSETCARVLPIEIAARYLKLGEILYDHVVPSSTRPLGGLYEAMEKYLADVARKRGAQ
jgi:hypothetical protein